MQKNSDVKIFLFVCLLIWVAYIIREIKIVILN